jgi:hypothetical protein
MATDPREIMDGLRGELMTQMNHNTKLLNKMARGETKDSLKAEVLHQLGLALEENPEMRVAQMITNAAAYVSRNQDVFYLKDEQLLEGLKAFSA